MKVKVDAPLLRSAARSILALSAFPGADKEGQSTNCLLTAKGSKLIVEAAALGVYIKHTIGAEVEQEGTAAIQASKLDKIRSTTFVHLSKKKKENSLNIKYGATKTKVDEPAKVDEAVANGRPKKGSVSTSATIDIRLVKDGLQVVSFKPGLKEEALRLQLSVSKGAFELSGLDSYSFARIKASEKKLFKCEKPFQVVLRSSVLTSIMKEIEQDEGKVEFGLRTNKKGVPVAIRIASKWFEVHYPLLNVGFVDLGEKLDSFLKKQKINASFVTNKHQFMSAISDCTALHSSKETGGALKLRLSINKKDVVVATDSIGAKSKTVIKPEKIKSNKKQVDVVVHEGYMSSFLNLSPENTSLRVESCGTAYLRIAAEGLSSGSIEYLVARVADQPTQKEEKE